MRQTPKCDTTDKWRFSAENLTNGRTEEESVEGKMDNMKYGSSAEIGGD